MGGHGTGAGWHRAMCVLQELRLQELSIDLIARRNEISCLKSHERSLHLHEALEYCLQANICNASLASSRIRNARKGFPRNRHSQGHLVPAQDLLGLKMNSNPMPKWSVNVPSPQGITSSSTMEAWIREMRIRRLARDWGPQDV